MTLDEFFSPFPQSRPLFDALHQAILELGEVELRVSKSQVAFRRRKAFAWAWIPGKYLPKAQISLVLTVALRRRDTSPRWKEIVEPSPGRFTHHLELHSPAEIDDQVSAWLIEAYQSS